MALGITRIAGPDESQGQKHVDAARVQGYGITRGWPSHTLGCYQLSTLHTKTGFKAETT